MKAKERHELKQNEFAEVAMRSLHWMEANRERAVTLGVVVALIVVVAGGYAWWRRTASNEAGGLLGAAAAVAQAPIAPAPTVPGATQQAGTYPTETARAEAALSAYEQVVEQFPSSDAALTARYTIGTLLLEIGRAAEAEVRFTEVEGAVQGKYDDAIALFTELSADRASQLPLDGILIQLARASAQAGRVDDARAAFRRIVDEFPASSYAAEARQELARLG
jgi:TolA-binding protein